MKTYKNLYPHLCSMGNLTLAWRKARKNKGSTYQVRQFERNIEKDLLGLHKELVSKKYKPKPLKTFILRDPKTRVISRSHFRDRVIHHALINTIGEIFEKRFIFDSCANQKNKGTPLALKRFEKFKKKVTKNNKQHAFCLKADIQHYFQEVNHNVLMKIISNKIKDKNILLIAKRILKNVNFKQKGMPLGNYTSQFFANVYLNELDYFVKHTLKAKYYIRYVDDFVILHPSKRELEQLRSRIDNFLRNELKIELHPDKSGITSLSKGIDFVGFRNYLYHRLPRKRNVRKMFSKVKRYKEERLNKKQILEIFQGWNAYSSWANSYKLRRNIVREIYG